MTEPTGGLQLGNTELKQDDDEDPFATLTSHL